MSSLEQRPSTREYRCLELKMVHISTNWHNNIGRISIMETSNEQLSLVDVSNAF